MCGLAGFWAGPGDHDALADRVATMAGTLAHRGPDDRGTWVDSEEGVAFGFRRLSVVDLTPTGHQPMCSADGRRVIVFNGEIYNYLELKQELVADGVRFRGTSDTEVVLEALGRWEAEAAFRRFNGMFAMAVWDREHRELLLARDRLGKKPLYYGRVGDAWVYGSELKSLMPYPGWTPELDHHAVAAYLQVGYVPAPRSIFRGIRKLPPGAIVRLRRGAEACLRYYWRATEAAEASARQPPITDPLAAVDEADALIRDSVRLRLRSDVPVGAFLSGGVDSSALVAFMRRESTVPVRTFSVGFNEPTHDEAHSALKIARYLGTEHTALTVRSDQGRSIIPRLPVIFDEPFADASSIPQLLVAEQARQEVTVALSGEGGDEAFGGYVRHLWAARVNRVNRRVPNLLRKVTASAARAVSPVVWDAIYGIARHALPRSVRVSHPGDKVHKLACSLGATDLDDVYRHLVSAWRPADRVLVGRLPPDAVAADPVPGHLSAEEYVRFRDLTEYLPGDILTKVDRTTMAVGLEARAPLLDYRLIEWTWRLGSHIRAPDGRGKWVLRQVLSRYVPDDLVDRPKQGFAVPIGVWLRGPLRDWAEDLLDERRLRHRGLLDPNVVRRVWSEHLTGRRNWEGRLWTVLMLEAWLDRWVR